MRSYLGTLNISNIAPWVYGAFTHIRAESRIENLHSELNKKNEVLLETQVSLGDAQKLSAKLEGQLMQYQENS